MSIDLQAIYQASWTAFDQGNYPKARLLASQCLSFAAQDSYIHYNALGLKCWAANYLGDNLTVEREATLLLSGKNSVDQRWFEALALFNLGLVHQRTRCSQQAKACFIQASMRYAAYRTNVEPPRARILTNQFFAALSHWAATGERVLLDQLAKDLASQPASETELEALTRAVDLYLRRADGEDVSRDAGNAANQGVSRALLAYLLLEPKAFLLH